MLGELLPVVVIPAAALVLAIRSPGQVTHGKAPLGPQVNQWLMSLGLLLVATYAALMAGPALAATDLGGMGVALVALPLGVAVAYALIPQQLDAAPKAARSPAKRATRSEPIAKTEPKSDIPTEVVAAPAHDDAAVPEQPAEPEAPAEPEGPHSIDAPEVDGATVSAANAIARIAEGLGDRPGVVFSPYAEPDANEALDRIASHLGARRYMSIPPEEDATDAAHLDAARAAAGPNAAHASELALDLAGGAISSLLMVDDRIELSALAISGLERVNAAIFCSSTENPVSAACDVRVPGEATGSARGELLTELAEKLGAPDTSKVDALFDAPAGPAPAAPLFPAPAVAPPPSSGSAPVLVPPSSSAPTGSDKPRPKSGLTGLFAAVGTPIPTAPSAPMTLPSVPTPSAATTRSAPDDEDADKSEEE